MPDGVDSTDGNVLPADVIVYATGYGSMNGWVADHLRQEMADKVGKVWGLGSATKKDPGPWEGEQRNMWKPTQQEALWFHGGNLHQSRYYSHFGAAIKGATRGHTDAGLWPAGSPSQGVKRGREQTIAHGSRTVAVARQAIPSPRPVKPSFSARRRLDSDAADVEARDLRERERASLRGAGRSRGLRR